ncbi:MAG: hydroxyethylthiazole kinase [Alphaproteobacteria bacterium]
MSAEDLTAQTMELLVRIRATRPAVHCLTNSVAQPITANALLAVGAVPSLTSDAAELDDFVQSADALLINLGTPSGEMRRARRSAVDTANRKPVPWVLDPVMVDRSPARLGEAREFLSEGPDVIRCNTAEADALSLHSTGYAGVIARTGETDHICQNGREFMLKSGHPMMAHVTAIGCALSAIVAAFLAVAPDRPFNASIGALTLFGAAGALAAQDSNGPGSFAAALLDRLYRMDEAALNAQFPITAARKGGTF